mmetsp:Transcript_30969/g.57709  ORF Transcript_30969/g.57709 Transcript_30969/m.57709 type:complete len:389 (+) Transcript_30969:74-1240(+)
MPTKQKKAVAAAASALPGFRSVPSKCLVTGGSGFVGQRLVEMLVERGASRVVSFDISPKPKDAMTSPKIQYVQGDLTKPADVLAATEGVDCVFHIAALVGPYHHKDAYVKVNYEGSRNVLEACNHWGVRKIVMSSSPSTRFPYPDPNIDGMTEDDLIRVNGGDYAPAFLQPYAETKAQGEKLIREACGTGDNDDDLLTIAVAPHQVYGPRDGLFLPNLLGAAGTGSLRIFGDGENRISFCHVDNYCHGLILGAEALYPHSPALGKFYIITDGPPVKFWHVLDEAGVAMGFVSMFTKFHLPAWLMMLVAHLVVFFGDLFAMVTGTPNHVVNYYVKLNPFAVKMLIIHRYFDIQNARRDLLYEPVIEFETGWKQTIEWFREHWLPTFHKK